MIQKDISLKEHSNFNIGGLADYFFEFNSKNEAIEALQEWHEMGKTSNIFILGKGTNILFNDEGFRGLILKNKISFLEKEDGFINVGAGVLIEDLVNFCIESSLSGLEWAGGLPGTVGGAIRGNAGAFGGETKDHILEVKSIRMDNFEEKSRDNGECAFGYRSSTFKNGDGKNEIIISAKFKVSAGNKDEIIEKTKEKVEYRENRHPLDYPNVGSIFKNIPWEEVPDDLKGEYEEFIKNDPFPILPVAKLLSIAGLKGKKIGGAMISEKHPNFIVNAGGATSKDVVDLIKFVKKEIQDKYQIALEEEIIIMSPSIA